MKEENIHDELRSLSPLLSSLKEKNDPHRLPDGYFDQLESSVFQRLEAEGLRVSVPETKSGWSVWLSPARLAAAAAAVAVLITAVWWLRPTDTPALTQTDTLEEITPEMAEAYIQENILDFEEDLLTANLDNGESNTSEELLPEPKPKNSKKPPVEDDLDQILDDLTEEELEDLL